MNVPELLIQRWSAEVLPLVRLALAEDIGRGDVTSGAFIPADHRSNGLIKAKQSVVLSGLPVAEEVFRQVDANLRLRRRACGGDHLSSGTIIAEVGGRTRSILSAERTALNFLQQLTGIATHTATYVRRLSGTGVRLLDTRKTLPGMRLLSKQAALDGGAVNHRLRLDDAVMLKDNHLAAVGGVTALGRRLEQLRVERPDLPIVMEIARLEDLGAARELPIDRVLLDNFRPAQVAEAVTILKGDVRGRRIEIEVSGGVTLETIAEYALPGVDFISVGSLTHSAAAADLSLDLETIGPGQPS